MLATSSHVTSSSDTEAPQAPVFAEAENEMENNLLPQLLQSATASKRMHLLVGRRKRAARRATH